MNLGSYYQSCSFVLFTYDITSAESFAGVKYFVDHMSVMCKNPFLVKVMVGCKSDRGGDRQVQTEEAAESAKEYGMTLHYEVSALTGHNVEEMF